MPEWRVRLNAEPPERVRTYHAHGDDDWVAACLGDLTVATADLHVKDEVLECSPEEIDRILVHELIHPLLDRVLDHVEILRDHVPPAVWDAYEGARTGDEEEFVNRLSHVIASHGEHGMSPYGTREAKPTS